MDDSDNQEFPKDHLDALKNDTHLVIMPITRLLVEFGRCNGPLGISFYPKYDIDLKCLKIIYDQEGSNRLAAHVSAASGMDSQILDANAVVVFPYSFDWKKFRNNSHKENTDFIRILSNYVDKECLNAIRYRHCSLDDIYNLPGRAGTIYSNRMMAGATLYNHTRGEGRIIGGDPFSHTVTKGLGLSVGYIEQEMFPKNGEVGHILNHSLMLYTALLETDSPTIRFTQAISLLEYLAFPGEYRRFQEVKKIISRYVATDQNEYNLLMERFKVLTGQKDESTRETIGLRTKIVHMGCTLDELLPGFEERQRLFGELDRYIRAAMDHMKTYSDLPWEKYKQIRDRLRPFEL